MASCQWRSQCHAAPARSTQPDRSVRSYTVCQLSHSESDFGIPQAYRLTNGVLKAWECMTSVSSITPKSCSTQAILAPQELLASNHQRSSSSRQHAATSVALYKLYHKKLDLELLYRHGVYSTVVHNNMNVSWDSDETFEKNKKQVVSFANSTGLH